jgi:hypothetical protein
MQSLQRCTYVSAQSGKSEVRLIRKETRMLSPHEFTTLMLVKDAPDQIEADRAELHTLLEHQLVTFEMLASGHRRPRITPQGHAVLKAVARIR